MKNNKKYTSKKSAPKGYHKMPSGELMKGSKHKKSKKKS